MFKIHKRQVKSILKNQIKQKPSTALEEIEMAKAAA
jgi:hypothetical protein